MVNNRAPNRKNRGSSTLENSDQTDKEPVDYKKIMVTSFQCIEHHYNKKGPKNEGHDGPRAQHLDKEDCGNKDPIRSFRKKRRDSQL